MKSESRCTPLHMANLIRFIKGFRPVREVRNDVLKQVLEFLDANPHMVIHVPLVVTEDTGKTLTIRIEHTPRSKQAEGEDVKLSVDIPDDITAAELFRVLSPNTRFLH